MPDDTATLNAVLLGTATSHAQAQHVVATMSGCPWIATATCTGCVVLLAFALPEARRWWLEYIPGHPQSTLGLERAELLWAQETDIPSPWALGTIRHCEGRTPCGAWCPDCPSYREQCGGCPAVLHWDTSADAAGS